MDPAKISPGKLQDLPHTSKIFITLKSLGIKTSNDGFSCIECKACFDLVDLLCHQLKSHKNDWIFLCKICKVPFHDLQAVTEHTENHSENDIEIFTNNSSCGNSEVMAEMKGENLNYDSKLLQGVKEEDFDDDMPLHFYQNSMPLIVKVEEGDFIMPYSSGTGEEQALLKKKKKRSLKSDSIRQCDFCKEFFPSRKLLQRHIMHTHLGKKKRAKTTRHYKALCSFCGCVFRNALVLRRHIVKHTNDTIHPCEKCDMQFQSSEDLTSHLRQDHACREPWVCRICQLPCKSPKLLKDHFEESHADTMLKCPTCDVTFRQKHKLKFHLEKYKGKCRSICDICQKTFRRENLKRHILSHQRAFQCSICPQTFSQKSSLKDHVNLHTGNRPYKCSKCEISFHSWLARKSHEESHFKVLAKKERTYPCTVCKASFPSRYVLRQHLLDVHGIDVYANGTSATGTVWEKPIVSPSTGMYECSQCDYKSEKKANFYAHRYNLHRENRQRHQCKICGKSFLSLRNYKDHIGAVHDGVKYPCPGCSKIFTTKNNLWQHTTKYCAVMRQKKSDS